MPDKDFLHRHPEFKDLVRIVAHEKRIHPYLVEKDYWVMHCLFGLRQAGYDFQLKGGTSLSKGYGIIHRFSEDIDIHITPPAELQLKTGKNHNKPHHVRSRRDYYDRLASEITIGDVRAERDVAFDETRYYRSGGIRLTYDSHFEVGASAAREGILLELGFDDIAPNKPLNISSWVYEHAASSGASAVDNRAKGVSCYDPGYTLVEKLQAIATKYRKSKEGKTPPDNLMRHYYDAYCLLQWKTVKEFTRTDAFRKHVNKRFPKVDLAVPFSENPAFLLSDPEDFETMKNKYVIEQALYYGEQPDFDKVARIIKQWALSQ